MKKTQIQYPFLIKEERKMIKQLQKLTHEEFCDFLEKRKEDAIQVLNRVNNNPLSKSEVDNWMLKNTFLYEPYIEEELKEMQIPLNFRNTCKIFTWIFRRQITFKIIPENILTAFKQTEHYDMLRIRIATECATLEMVRLTKQKAL